MSNHAPARFLILHQYRALPDTRHEPGAGVQYTHLVTQDVDGFVQKKVVGIFPHFFSGKFRGKLAFTRLQAIIPLDAVVP